jgi:hypothetical protein
MDPKHEKRLHKHANLTDILIQFEDFLDNLDLYVFKNWFEGEIIKGPEIRRYWVEITLMYPYKQMPDPNGAVRLVKHGAKVLFTKDLKEVSLDIDSSDDYDSNRRGKPKTVEEPIWLVNIKLPRKFIDELDDDDLELYDDEIEQDDISDARDENIEDDEAIKNQDAVQNPDEERI